MSEMSFEQMLEESFKTIRNGEVVEGTVIDVKPDEIILNIGYKSDGIIPKNEFSENPDVDPADVVKAGDNIPLLKSCLIRRTAADYGLQINAHRHIILLGNLLRHILEQIPLLVRQDFLPSLYIADALII